MNRHSESNILSAATYRELELVKRLGHAVDGVLYPSFVQLY
jgi:hypothetical protein